MHHPDPMVKLQWGLKYMFRSLLAAAVVFLIEWFFAKNDITIFTAHGIVPAFILGIGIIYSLVFPFFKYKRWMFSVDDREIIIQRGVLTHIYTIAPIVRIQHIDVEQSLLDRMLQLGKLIVYTAGTRGVDLTIPGLPIDYAEMLRDQLRNYSAEDAV
ncbi:MAG: PH domain-containing protein [Candidatus Kapaibacterium sp.]